VTRAGDSGRGYVPGAALVSGGRDRPPVAAGRVGMPNPSLAWVHLFKRQTSWCSNAYTRTLSASPAQFDLIGGVDFHRSDVDGPGYTVGKYQARSDPEIGHLLPGQLALRQVARGKAVCVHSSHRAVAPATRPVSTGAGGQSGRPGSYGWST
jgi:hypothetical protein